MITFQKLTDLGVFVATGYICAGTAIAVLGGIPLFTTYFESTFLLVSVFILGVVLVAGILGILIMHYAVRKVGAKQVFEQDILVYIIGMLFMALTLNKAMFLVGLFISSMALPVFFYENFTRQVKVARGGGSKVLALAGWALGPAICFLALVIFQDYGMLTARIIFAHFIVLGFWVWVKRLDTHEQYADAPTLLLHNLPWEEKTSEDTKDNVSENKSSQEANVATKESTASDKAQDEALVKEETKATSQDASEAKEDASSKGSSKDDKDPKKDQDTPLGI